MSISPVSGHGRPERIAARRPAERQPRAALAAFLRIVGFSGDPIMLGRAPDYVPSTLHTIHPTYGRLMLSLGELFLALERSSAPHSICLSVSDLVPGRARLERGALYRAVSTLRKAYPDQRLRPTNSERYRLESAMEFIRAGSMPNSDRQEFIGTCNSAEGRVERATGQTRTAYESRGKGQAGFRLQSVYRSLARQHPRLAAMCLAQSLNATSANSRGHD